MAELNVTEVMNKDEKIKATYLGLSQTARASYDAEILKMKEQLSRIKSIIKSYGEGCRSEFATINSIRRVVSE